MDQSSNFMREAEKIADAFQQQVEALEREISDLKAQLASTEITRNSRRLAPKRLANYQVLIGGHYQCPRCWIEYEAKSSLRPYRGTPDTDDFFRCDRDHTFSF